MGGSVDVVVLVAGIVEIHDLCLALGHVVDHLLHDASVVQHGLCAHPLLGAGDTAIHVSQIVLDQFCGTLGRGAVGIDGLAEATLRQVIRGQRTAHTDGRRLKLVDLVAHALHRDCADTRRHKGCYLAVAVHVLGQYLVGAEDVSLLRGKVAVTEKSLLGHNALLHGHQGIGVKEIQFSRHCSSSSYSAGAAALKKMPPLRRASFSASVMVWSLIVTHLFRLKQPAR